MQDNQKKETKSLTVLLQAGHLPPDLLRVVDKLTEKLGLRLYLSTAQNLRLMEIPLEQEEMVRAELAAVGAVFKGPGQFPLPKICIGSQDCKLGLVDTERLSQQIIDRFGSRINVKPKFKISLSGCPASCSGALLADIGVVATRAGYDVFAGGKGGPLPKVGRRIVRKADEEKVLEVIGCLVDFHDAKTSKKQRLSKLLADPEFPFSEV